MYLLILVACGPSTEDTAEETPEVVDAPDAHVDIVPPAVDFGTTILGTPSEETVTVVNSGEIAVVLSAASVDADSLSLVAPTGTTIAPGGEADVTVTWAPSAPDAIEATMSLFITSTAGGITQMPVPVTGTAGGPTIHLSATTEDFGEVNVGCSESASLLLTNTGTTPLTISDIALTEAFDFALSADGAELALPWTLEPHEGRTVRIAYTPLDEAVLTTVLKITSDDPFYPVVDVPVSGTGNIEADNSITWDVPQIQNVTVLFAMNLIAISDPRFDDAVPGFFDTLQTSHAHYRVAFLGQQDGVVTGNEPYIDDTMTTDEAVDIVDDMLADVPPGLDNDYLLETLDHGIEENTDWLLTESAEWEDSRLSLIGINSDQEQSSGDYMSYLLDYWTYKDDPDNILVHAIGGDSPRGCSGAEPFTPFADAATATGGTFLSWCTPDWIASFESLATAALGEQPTFFLTGDPAEWSIEVWVDDLRQTEGWTYDPTTLEVTFDDAHFPEPGSTVQIDYLMNVDCPDAG